MLVLIGGAHVLHSFGVSASLTRTVLLESTPAA